jgi:hypothetical protein
MPAQIGMCRDHDARKNCMPFFYFHACEMKENFTAARIEDSSAPTYAEARIYQSRTPMPSAA